MVFIFGVDFSGENNNVPLRNKSDGGAYSRDNASSSLLNDHYGHEFLAKDSKKICSNEENVMRGSNPNIDVTMNGNKVVKSEQQQPSNSKTSLNINHVKNDSICRLKVENHEFPTPSMTFSCIICQKQFPSKRALGGHKKVHKAKRENHHQENDNKAVSKKGKEVVQSEQYQPSSSKMPIYIDLTKNGPVHDYFIPSETFSFNRQFSSSPTLRKHQKSHKREREIHGQENDNNYKKVVTMKGKEVVKSEQHQPSNSVMLIPIVDLTNNGSICGWMKVQEHDIFTSSRTFPCKICNRQFFSAQALGGHGKVHKRKLKHPQEMENFSIKLEDNVGESSMNVDMKSRGDYHDTIKEEPFQLDLSLKL